MAYLRPAITRKNLTLKVNVLVTNIVLEGKQAVGIQYVQDGNTFTAFAEREVLLSAGVINSPQLLMLSGIGNPQVLRPRGIPVKVRLNGVGRNLQDHLSANVNYTRREPGRLHRAMRIDRLAMT